MIRVTSLLPLLGLLLAAEVASAGGTTRDPSKPRVHVVQRGQTLAMIAKRYNVSVDALRRANDVHSGKSLKPNQQLIVPGPEDKDGAAARAEREAGALERHVKPAAATAPVVDSESRGASSYVRKPRRPGYVVIQSTVGSFSGYAVKGGKVPKAATLGITRALASWRTHQKLQIDEKLIQMIAHVSDHFGGRPLRVVSGYRPYRPTQYTQHSRHNLGHAVDFTIPGIPNSVLRDYCRTLPNAGCGYYPNSSFVHMDFREASTYWVDYAGPGEAPRYATARGADPGRAEHDAAERESEPDTSSEDGAKPGTGGAAESGPPSPDGSSETPQDSQANSQSP